MATNMNSDGRRFGILGYGYSAEFVLEEVKQQHPDWKFLVTTTSRDRAIELQNGGLFERVFFLDLEADPLPALTEFLRLSSVVLVAVAPKNPQEYEATYVTTAKRVCGILTELANQDPSHKVQLPAHLIVLSSTGVYPTNPRSTGPDPPTVSETTQTAPSTPSQQALVTTEKLYLDTLGSIPSICLTIFRLSGIHGPNRTPVNRILSVAGTCLSGSGDAPVNFIEARDIARAVPFAIEKRLDGIYNLTDGVSYSRKKYYGAILEKHGKAPVTFDPSRPVAFGGNRIISNSKICQAGFVFKFQDVLKMYCA